MIPAPQGSIYVSLVPTVEVPRVWPFVRSLVLKVEDISDGRYNINEIYADLEQGRKLLWIAFRSDENGVEYLAFAVTVIRFYSDLRMLSVDFMGGDNMESWLGLMNDTLTSFAASQDCQGLEAVGRMGWQKALAKLGWAPKFVIVEKKFTIPEALRKEAELAIYH